MSSLRISHKHNLPHDEARAHADKVARELSDEFGLKTEWMGDTLVFERPGIEGELILEEDEVIIEMTLGFLMSAIKGRVEQEIRRFLAENFN